MLLLKVLIPRLFSFTDPCLVTDAQIVDAEILAKIESKSFFNIINHLLDSYKVWWRKEKKVLEEM